MNSHARLAKHRQTMPSVLAKIDQIQVCHGETLTVWLGSIDDEEGRTQVELRVLPSGKREVYVDTGASVLDFDDWYSGEGHDS